jgi:hypothetical protein
MSNSGSYFLSFFNNQEKPLKCELRVFWKNVSEKEKFVHFFFKYIGAKQIDYFFFILRK